MRSWVNTEEKARKVCVECDSVRVVSSSVPARESLCQLREILLVYQLFSFRKGSFVLES